MSVHLIQKYHSEVEDLIRYSGSRNESVIRKAFQNLLDTYSSGKNLLLVPEVEFITNKGHKVYPDGTLKDALRQNWGFWESKDERDNLEDEIKTKFAKGYPAFNILFEDSHTAILYQNGERVKTSDFKNDSDLDDLITLFINYEPKEVREFHKAIEQFTLDVPELAKTLRTIIEEQINNNPNFKTRLKDFLELCKKSINPKVEMADIREMIIQHILTEDIFMRIFDDAEFHRENVIAKNLTEVVGAFYTGSTRRNIYTRISHYYETINAKASQISDHHEKQKFLKALYESFYKAYNPKAADRLGVIYTPEEIVRFMVESTDLLLHKHFNKTLGDPYIEILDPATGTGTFITELIEYLPLSQLENKYANEIHCNEVAILPYYIANLNIEFTYKQKTGNFVEFENICFVDTLDNIGFTRSDTHQIDFFGLWDENSERIGRQNSKKISVIIGNPPYNANQLNENENNKNRQYPAIDKRIKETYIKYSTAQKTKLYDMYSRFYRWASDRIYENGIIAFITNRSFLDSRTFDGFRKVIADDFSYIYIIDLGGDIRKNPKLSGPIHNVFAIQTGVAIAFLIKDKNKNKKENARIYYFRRPELELAKEKLDFLNSNKISDINFNLIKPDKKNYWLNLPKYSWDDLIPVANKATKFSTGNEKQKSIFKLYSLGVVTNRDDWVYGESEDLLLKKISYFINEYNKSVDQHFGKVTKENIGESLGESIKWTRAVKNDLLTGKKYILNPENIIDTMYRPFTKRKLYFSKELNEMQYQVPKIFKGENIAITISGKNNSKPFCVLATNKIFDLHFIGDSQCLPVYRYTDTGERIENITDWALEKFQKHYRDKSILKQDVFNYVYAILHNTDYREKYNLNLKQDYPYIPFCMDFWKWVNWGDNLMVLHINYGQIEPYPFTREDKNSKNLRTAINPRLIAHEKLGEIEIDTITTLSGIPRETWTYKLGNYSAMKWILESYKEKKPRDITIRDKFNTYKFSDYKEEVIDLLGRVCTVSIETMKLVNQMPKIE